MPAVEGGILPPGTLPGTMVTAMLASGSFQRFEFAEGFSAGLEATALRQAGCPPLPDLRSAQAAAYAAVEKIHFDGAHYRRDIAAKAF